MDRNAPTPSIRPQPTVMALALMTLAAVLSGCSEPGPFLRRQTMMGALKTDVAQLESEKAQLRREVADLKAENRRMESQVAEIEAQNGDLTARLDDARALISRQGLDTSNFSAPSRSASDDRATPRRSNPVRQPKRKTPMAEIPRDRRPLPDRGDLPLDDPIEAPSPADRDSTGPQSRLDDRSPWLPVARGTLDGGRRVR